MDVQKLFRKKTVEDILKESENYEEGGLKRALGPWELVFLGIGAIIGAGIFVITGTAAAGGAGHVGAGPAIVLSFLFTGLACSFAALCYAEFASMIPIAGSAYTYSYATLGELIAWIIGWDLILEYMVASSAVAIGWSGYCKSFLETLGTQIRGKEFDIPGYLSTDIMTAYEAAHHPDKYITKIYNKTPDLASQLSTIVNNPDIHDKPQQILKAMNSFPDFADLRHADGLLNQFYHLMSTVTSAPQIDLPFIGIIPFCVNIPAAAVIIAITALLVLGVSESAKTNTVIVFLKFAILATFVIVGLKHVDFKHWEVFMPNGLNGVFVGSSMIFFAYIGFDALSTTAEECSNPSKDLPFGIIGALSICTLLYVIISGIMTAICPWDRLGTAEPVATALHYVGEHAIASYIVSIGAVISLLAVLIVMLMAQPRIFMCMSRDGFIPKWLSKIHPRFRTPYRSTIINGIIVALTAAVFNINEIAELCNIGTLFAFVIVCTSVIIFRKKSPDTHRPFKTPFVPWVPIGGIVTCFWLMYKLPLTTWIRFFLWLGVGLVIYFLYGIKHTDYGDNPVNVGLSTEERAKGNEKAD